MSEGLERVRKEWGNYGHAVGCRGIENCPGCAFREMDAALQAAQAEASRTMAKLLDAHCRNDELKLALGKYGRHLPAARGHMECIVDSTGRVLQCWCGLTTALAHP